MTLNKMNAIVQPSYGSPDVFRFTQVAKPIPKANEVLVKVRATPVTKADTMIRTGKPYFGRLLLGLTKPKNPIPGTGFAGTIEAVGEEVSLFKIGEDVFGETTLKFGANAEYICIPEDGVLLRKPENMTFEQAAPICDGALTSFNFLKEIIKIQPGQKVLINGASGGLGTAAVQLAKHFGAHVTGVCSSRNITLVKSLGADEVIDYTKNDFTEATNTYDIIFDAVGKSSFSKSKSALTEHGVYLSPVLSLSLLFQVWWTSKVGKKKAKFSATGLLPHPKLIGLLKELKQLIEKGVVTTFIDKRYALDQIAEAHAYVDTGHKRGNVVIVI